MFEVEYFLNKKENSLIKELSEFKSTTKYKIRIFYIEDDIIDRLKDYSKKYNVSSSKCVNILLKNIFND
jgi:hypothetical protein